jgi:beta-lactam-binding protein with PASTA domain/tRNA A-37 threonylcarbamoyl transferase component Bud32
MTGQILGNRYEVQELLGQGGMAQVYRARDRVLGRSVAIKILRAEYASDASLVARFQREARAAANLVHPNIVAIYDVGQDGAQFYIVMEYITGPTLKEIIRQRAPLTVELALKVTEQVCAALEYAHRHGVIHRDIKPQNILLSEEEEVVKVADFGIAKSQLDPETTADRLALGTVKYISPEQARGIEVVPQSDIYSLGVVLFEMLTGQQPFDGDTPVSIALAHVEAPPPRPRQLNPYIPPAVEGIILRSLSKDPAERFASAREMRQSLERYRMAGFEATGPIPQSVSTAADMPARPPRPAPVTAVEAPGRASYAIPRRPATPATRSTGLGPLGIILLVLIAAALISLAVLISQAFPTIVQPGPTATPTVAPTSTPLPKMPVPDLRGSTLDEARARLDQSHLLLAQGKPRFDPSYGPGQIVDQTPEYGIYVEQGTVVTVSLWAQPGLSRVPQVVQARYEAAELTLKQAGFRVQREDVGCTSTPAGFVDRQDPRGGIQDIQGITVTVYVSIGDQAVLPELLRVPLLEAQQRVEAAGLTWGYPNPQTQADMPPGVNINDKGAPGQVISYRVLYGSVYYTEQQMPAGTLIPCGTMVYVAYYATTP